MERRETVRILYRTARTLAAASAFGALSFTAGYVARGGVGNLAMEDAALAGRQDARFSESCAVRSGTPEEHVRRAVLNRLPAKDQVAAALVRRLSCREERVRLLADTPGANPFVDSSDKGGYYQDS